ncbi:MAG: hypothetical protein IJU40_02175 [Desulfovibrionaceae bacterium]|nr:hypothetical protein [Desulfovibrionaceae bacterium]
MDKSVKVSLEKCPRIFRHIEEDSAIHDAKSMTTFLKYSLEGMFDQIEKVGIPANGEYNQVVKGISLCFDVLLDKLDMASGDQKWPLAAIDCDTDLAEALKSFKKIDNDTF